MKAYWGSRNIAPCILDLGSRWRWMVSFTPRPLYPYGKRPWYALDRRLGGPQTRSGRGGEDKNSQHLPVLEHRIIQSVVQRCTTELSRFRALLMFTSNLKTSKQSHKTRKANKFFENFGKFECTW
jgi:hypothetical protein